MSRSEVDFFPPTDSKTPDIVRCLTHKRVRIYKPHTSNITPQTFSVYCFFKLRNFLIQLGGTRFVFIRVAFLQTAKSIDFICRQISYEPQTKEYHFIKGTKCYMVKFLSFLSLKICALQSDFAINAAENCSPLVPVEQKGQIYRKLLLAAWRDKAGHIKTSSLACGTVQPAWITLLYT